MFVLKYKANKGIVVVVVHALLQNKCSHNSRNLL